MTKQQKQALIEELRKQEQRRVKVIVERRIKKMAQRGWKSMTILIKNGEKLTEQCFVNLIQKFRARSGLEIVRIRKGKEIVLKPIARMNLFCWN